MYNDSNYIVGCSPGEHRDSLRTIFTDVGNGTIIEQVVPKCVECSIGQYQDNVAQTNCHTCPDYYSTSTTGSSTSAQCTSELFIDNVKYNLLIIFHYLTQWFVGHTQCLRLDYNHV